MEKENFNQIIRELTKLILTSQQKMVREEDLKNLCEGSNFEQIINDIYLNLKNVGLELIKTKFLDQKYYVLTSEGKDDNITPSQYGTLALILTLSKEADENIKLHDLKDIFSEVWTSDVEFLIEKDYLRKFSVDDFEIVKVTPIGKAIFKNIIHDVQLKNLIEVFKDLKL